MAVRGRPTDDLNAWDCYQRGLWHLYRFTTEELETSKTLFERAIALDPNFSQAYARLAYVFIQFGWYGPREERTGRVNRAAMLARQAVELDRRDPAARLSLGRALALSGAMDSGVEELRAAVALDPSFAQAHFALAQALCGLDRHEEAMREINMAIQLSPRDPHMWTFLHVRAIARYIANDLEQAEADERAALRQPNVTFYPYTVLVAILGRKGNTEKAKTAVAELLRLRPGFTCEGAVREWYFGDHPFATRRFLEQFAADVRSSGLPG
jgi:tetratricopeptide (TPR) repeat protein